MTERNRGYPSGNHHAAYVPFVRNLSDNINVVFTRTDHWQSSKDFYHRLAVEVDRNGGEFRWFKRHIYFEVDGTQAAVINGVEASVRTHKQHVVVCGLPIEDEREFHNLSEREFFTVARKAEWTAPAHPFLPGRRGFSDELLESLFDTAQGSDGFTIAIGYMTGYTPRLNMLARGMLRPLQGKSVLTYAKEYDIPVIPELDWHVAVPERLAGVGIIRNDSVMDRLRGGEVSTDQLLNTQVVTYHKEGQEGMKPMRFIASFPLSLPLYHTGVYDRFLPYAKEEFEAIRDESLASISAISERKLLENSYNPEDLLNH